jgi:hypothetical protein
VLTLGPRPALGDIVDDSVDGDIRGSAVFAVEGREVDNDTPLVTIAAFEVKVASLDTGISADNTHHTAGGIARFRFNLDDISPQVTQPHSGNGTLLELSQFDYLYSVKWSGHIYPPVT